MKEKLESLIGESKKRNELFTPFFYRLANADDKKEFDHLLENTPALRVFDEIEGQLEELVKLRFPKIKFKAHNRQQLKDAIKEHLGDCELNNYGVWVYYPWSLTLVHLLDEEEFIEVRTNRNKYKITEEEAATLTSKKIGVMGLSVGRSIAMTMATERIAGEIRLADFDILELSNYNRIQASLNDLGVPKVISAARQIAEIDPFLKVVCYHEGITEENILDFFTQGGKLDIVLDECDGLDIKVFGRKKAKELGIPVVMDTSDRGMLDIERFDLEPDRPILHGLIDHLDTNNLKGLTNEEKIPYILPMVGMETISPRLKASMIEVEQTITTWPQLASSVMLGGAIAIDVCRRIALNQLTDSGRYYVDVEEIIANKNQPVIETKTPEVRASLTANEMQQIISKYSTTTYPEQIDLDKDTLEQIIVAAVQAPSGANSQPWQWMYSQQNVYLFFDDLYTAAVLDHENTTTMVSFGTALENLVLKAHEIGLEVFIDVPELSKDSTLVAVVKFFKQVPAALTSKIEPHICDELVATIPHRLTNRNIGERHVIEPNKYEDLRKLTQTIPGADLHLVTDPQQLDVLEEIIGKMDRIRFMDKGGHVDLQAEVRWTELEAEQSKNGIDLVNTTDLTPSELAGFRLIKSWPVVKLLNDWKKGSGLEKIGRKSVACSSAIGLLTMPSLTRHDFLQGGRAAERMWLLANQEGIAVHPISIATLVFNVFRNMEENLFSEHAYQEIAELRTKFENIFDLPSSEGEVLLFRFFIAGPPKGRSKRYPLEQVLHFDA